MIVAADAPSGSTDAKPADAEVLRVSSISKSFGDRKVLNDLSLRVRSGEVVGLLGPDGAGKTLCFEIIMGMTRADAGSVVVRGVDVTLQPSDRRALLGLTCLSQEPSIFRGMTVEQNILAVLELHQPRASLRPGQLEHLLREFDLEHLRMVPAPQLSGGERRRCEIARAIAADPAVMLLDEPFAGLDPLAILEIKRAILTLKARKVGLLISDHNVRDLLDMLDRACVIYRGHAIFEGSAGQMVEDPDVRRLYLGTGGGRPLRHGSEHAERASA